MVTDLLKEILKDSGCTLVVYEQRQLTNLYTDQSNPLDIVGIIHRPDSILLEVRANAIQEHYNPMVIEVIKQVTLEEFADVNEDMMQELLEICKQIIVRLIMSAGFKTITPVPTDRVLENRYDANLIGWAMNIDLWHIENETKVPC